MTSLDVLLQARYGPPPRQPQTPARSRCGVPSFTLFVPLQHLPWLNGSHPPPYKASLHTLKMHGIIFFLFLACKFSPDLCLQVASQLCFHVLILGVAPAFYFRSPNLICPETYWVVLAVCEGSPRAPHGGPLSFCLHTACSCPRGLVRSLLPSDFAPVFPAVPLLTSPGRKPRFLLRTCMPAARSLSPRICSPGEGDGQETPACVW